MKSGSGLLISALFLVLVSSCYGQFYNTRCASHQQCHSHQFLQCMNGYCQCDSRSQVFDHSLQQCVIRPGGKCYFAKATNTKINGATASIMKCSRNSVCLSSTCQCEPGYTIPSSSEVLCKPSHHARCKHSGECETTKGLDCVHGICQCRNATLSYQGMFGCVDTSNAEFREMIAALQQTDKLLKENNLNLNEIIQETSNANLDDLITAPQTQIEARQGGGGGGGGGGLFGGFNPLRLIPGLGGRGAGASTAYGPPAAGGGQGGDGGSGGYSGGSGGTPGTSGGYGGGGGSGGGFPSITNFLNTFNRLLPVIRRLASFLNPFRIIRRLLMNFNSLFGRGGQGGYSGGGGSGSPSTSYGPPGAGNTGGGGTSSAYGAPAPNAQAVSGFNQITSIQSNAGQSNFNSFPTSASTSSLFDQNSNQYQSAPLGNTNKRQVGLDSPNQNFGTSTSFNANQNTGSNNQYSSNPNELPLNNEANNPPPFTVLSVSRNKYPRQERLSNIQDESPFLPEHL